MDEEFPFTIFKMMATVETGNVAATTGATPQGQPMDSQWQLQMHAVHCVQLEGDEYRYLV